MLGVRAVVRLAAEKVGGAIISSNRAEMEMTSVRTVYGVVVMALAVLVFRPVGRRWCPGDRDSSSTSGGVRNGSGDHLRA